VAFVFMDGIMRRARPGRGAPRGGTGLGRESARRRPHQVATRGVTIASPSAVSAMIHRSAGNPGAGARRARRSWANRWRPCRVVVVGDTPKDIAAAQASAPSVLRWPRHALVAELEPTRPRSPVHPARPAPTLSCSGLMFAGWFGVDRHTSQVGICSAQILFDALGEACASLMASRPQGAMKGDRQFVSGRRTHRS